MRVDETSRAVYTATAVLGADEFVFRSVGEEFIIRARHTSLALTSEQLTDARRVAFALRYGIETGDPTTVAVARQLEHALSNPSSSFNPLLEPSSSGLFANWLAERLREELELGRLLVERIPQVSLSERREAPPEVLPPLPPQRETNDTFFEVRLVDEIGQAISGAPVELDCDGEIHDLSTNAAGVALLEPVTASSAAASVSDPLPVQEALDPRWAKRRAGTPPKVGNLTELVFDGAPIGPVAVKAAVPNTVVLKPRHGRLFVQLFDKTGRVQHAGRDYTISGPESFSGTTDDRGILQHDDVFPGDYTLSLTLDFFEGDDKQTDQYESPLVVLDATETEPETRRIGAVPISIVARLQLFFNTNKTFLLPTALPGIFELREIYRANSPSKVLVVGHADTSGGSAFNDQLSLERAEATIAFLKDDVDAWLKFYEASVPAKKRWGGAEDRMMVVAMPDFGSKGPRESAVRWFQRTRSLTVDGIAGPETRRQLVTEYMALDGVSLEEFGASIEATAHGCGENFPLDDAGAELDAAPADQKRDPIDRRVELFFFDPEFGIVPPPPGKNSAPGSAQYPIWRKSALRTIELSAEDFAPHKVTFIELADAHFRSNSAVVLPEGETATNDEDSAASFTSVGVFATALRFNESHPGKQLFVAGHCDTTATIDFNQKLSGERAQCALALLIGGDAQREAFKTLCNARHQVSDYKQILAWVVRAFPELAFNCDPGSIDENAATGVEPVRRFQAGYNHNKAALGATGPDLATDGDIGPLTWGAIFDCYEAGLRRELGEDAAGLQALRQQLAFVDDERKALGFSEYFPIEELGVDNFRSEENRRVEILFFDSGEEPNLFDAEADPETSELYLPGNYVRTSLEPARAALGVRDLQIFLLDNNGLPSANAPYKLSTASQLRTGVTDANGRVLEKDVGSGEVCEIEWGTSSDDATTPIFPNYAEIFLNATPVDGGDELVPRQLFNLGYWSDDLSANRQAFLLEYTLPDASDSSVNVAHETGQPKRQRALG